jgi:16S rRNA (guanine527-N7)-methyltransferase
MEAALQKFKNKFNVSRETIEKIAIYKDFILESNKKFNLIGKSTEKDLFIRHFTDSAQLYGYFKNTDHLFDFGSGAGFPGMIIKLISEDHNQKINVYLVDKSKKKCDFLFELADKLNIKIIILNNLVSDIKMPKNSSVTSRAFKSLINTFDEMKKNIKNVKQFILLKGKSYQQEIDDALHKYEFKCQKYKSITSDEGKILKIEEVNIIQSEVVNA